MTFLRTSFLRLAELFRKSQRDSEIAAELDSHLHLHIEDNVREGMTLEAARRKALLKLGGLEQTKEVYRDRRSFPFLEAILQDLRFAVRMLCKYPVVTLVAMLTLALGIGVNTGVFSWIHTIVMNPVPGVAAPERLVTVFQSDRANVLVPRISYPDFEELGTLQNVFEGLVGTSPAPVILNVNGHSEWAAARVATADSFSTLGVRAELGRTFLPEEDQGEGGHPVLMISHGLWQNEFGGDREILRKIVRLNQQQFSIVGITPPGFQGVTGGSRVDIWAPLSMHDAVLRYGSYTSRSLRWIQPMARLRPGVKVSTAQAALATLSARLESAYPDSNRDIQFRLFPLWNSPLSGQAVFLPVLRLLAAVGVGLLLIVTSNVSCLLLARATEREREVAVRLAIGANRARLIRQFLTENVVLAIAADSLGLLFARYAINLFHRFAPQGSAPYRFDFALNWQTIAFSLLVSLLSVLLFGLAPGLRISRADLRAALHQGGRGAFSDARQQRALNSLIVSEVAISVVLLIGAGLCVKGFRRASHLDLGYVPENVLYAGLNLVPNEYSPEQAKIFDRELRLRLAALPGAVDAAFVNTPPLGPSGLFSGRVDIEGREVHSSESHLVPFLIISPGYFSVLRIPILGGREFTDLDDSNRGHVAVVNETMVRRYWAGLDPIGRRFQMAVGIAPSDTFTIVGVARDTKSESLSEPSTPLVYVNYLQRPIASLYMNILLRTREDPELMAPALRREIHALDPRVEPLGIQPFRQYIQQASLPARIAGESLSILGATALLLTSLGLYGVMTYSINRRTHEIGIRRALGLQQGHAVQLVLRQGMRLVAVGIVAGLASALGLTRLVANFLYGVSTTDAGTFLGATLVLAAVAFAACYLPARRAARVDPIVALRYE